MKIIIVFSVMLSVLCITNAIASEPTIPGAFGLKFGEKYNSDTMYKDGTMLPIEIGIMVPINPPQPLPEFFDTYQALLTLKTLKIFGITASKLYSSEKLCNKKLNKIESMFSKAYGKEVISNRNMSKELTLNNVYVRFDCTKNKLRITYVNEKASKL